MKLKKIIVMMSIFAVAAFALSLGCDSKTTSDQGPPIGKSLRTYQTCEELEAALAEIPIVEQTWDFDSRDDVAVGGNFEEQPTSAQEEDSADTAGDSNASEVTVEEADIAKSDGNYVYVLHHSSKLMIFSALDPNDISRIGELELENRHTELVVAGDLLVAIGFSGGYYVGGGGIGAPEPAPATLAADISADFTTVITIIDVSDRSDPKLVREIKMDGNYVDSRLVGSFMHIVSTQWKEIEAPIPPTPDDLSPDAVDSKYAGGGREDSEVPTECSDIYVPDPMRFDSWGEYYPVQTSRIITIDLTDLEAEPKSTVVLAAWPTVGASAKRLMLADWDATTDVTALHIMDIETDPSIALYVGDATFNGMVLNQFSMNEYDNMIRVAVTTNRNTAGSDDNDNRVLVFKEESDGIEEIGRVAGITPGESIWSARFVEDKGFLVTYLTIDPLITVDLSDPTNPFVAGELEVPGVSTYLEPMDEDHLIAVGLDLEPGQTWGGGVALQIFDVSDFSNPQLAHRVVVGGEGTEAYSEANSTHKAFAYFPDKGLVAVPLTQYPMYGEAIALSAKAPIEQEFSSKLYVYQVDVNTGFTEAAVINHIDLVPASDIPEWGLYGLAMRRALLANDIFFSLSDYGLKAYDTDNLASLLFEEYLGISSYY
jgi:uncharacterized secreted protein with C-terminal beta-propeller domain